ncbi:MAG: hypothetical protein WC294_01105 [Methanoregula sp.]|jgi:hypothetical protein
MADDDVQIESAAGELASGIREASARMMKAAYLQTPLKKESAGFGVPFFKTPPLHHDEEVPGPGARVYITKMANRTPDDEIKRIISPAAERNVVSRTHNFYTLLFYLNIQLDEPSTTRFINATVSFVFSPGNKILDYSPKEKEKIANIAETGSEEIFLSQALDLRASFPQREAGNPDDPGSRFEIRIGPEEKIPITYSKKKGYSLLVPKCRLLEYEGMRKNDREVYWEIYPPMPPRDREITGKEWHAIFSLIVEVPLFSLPEVIVRIAGKVKGEIWGIVKVNGVLDF